MLQTPVDFALIKFHLELKETKDYNSCSTSGEGFVLLEVLFHGKFLPAAVLALPFPLPSCEK